MGDQQKCYSLNGDYYIESFEEMIREITDEYEVGDRVTYWEADIKRKQHSDFLSVGWLLEDMQNRACDEMGEYSYEYLDDVSEEKSDELRDIIEAWLKDNANQPTCFLAENSIQIDGWWNGSEIQFIPMLSKYDIDNLLD